MGLRTYKVTGAMLGVLGNRLKVRMVPSGLENLQDRPTLFVVNHFTRLETFGAPDFHWINVRVDPEDPRVFRISERLIPENFEGYDDRELGFNQ